MEKSAQRGLLRPEKAELEALAGRIGARSAVNRSKRARSRREGLVRELDVTYSDLPKHAQAAGFVVAARDLGLVKQTLCNWVKAAEAGKLMGAATKAVTAEQMERSRLRAENARLKMHVEIQMKSTAYFSWVSR
jgi:transposase